METENIRNSTYMSYYTNNTTLTPFDCYKNGHLFLAQFANNCKGVIMVIGAIFNFVIIIVICWNKRLHTVSRVVFVSLAVSDLINSIINGVLWLIVHVECNDQLSVNTISIFIFCLRVGIISNLFNHLIISVEQWLYIVLPFLHHRIVTRQSTAYCLIFVWALSVTVNCNLLLIKCPINILHPTIENSIICGTLYFCLSFIMLFIYTHIAFIAHRQTQLIKKTRPVPLGARTINTTWTQPKTVLKNIRLLVYVFGTFFILMTPGCCMDIYANVSKSCIYLSDIGKVIDAMWCSHCCTNLFIFAVQDNVFRDVLKQKLTKIGLIIFRKKVHPLNSLFQTNIPQNM
jgi:hypothetical protein